MDAGLEWSGWQQLEGAGRNRAMPDEPGLYRIRRVGRDDLDYIGQTGMGLRRRLAMLDGVYRAEMPYGDPHTAGPALWALRHATGCAFEASVATYSGGKPQRLGMEAVAIGLYRQRHGASPTVNFGRMPSGYRGSSSNTAKLVAAGKRYRGGVWPQPTERHRSGVAPAGPLEGEPVGLDWCGHRWMPWGPAEAAVRAATTAGGIYRLRAAGGGELLYVGQGMIGSRIAAHLQKRGKRGHEQGAIFAAAGALEASWAVPEAEEHQLLELENDLIAAHVLAMGRPPAAQFLG